MNRLLGCYLLLALVTPSIAQDAIPGKRVPPAISRPVAARAAEPEREPEAVTLPSGNVSVTPEMWIYQQERNRQSDPKEAHRTRAQYEADLRRLRLNTQKFYGYSASRPTASLTPFCSTYSPMWVGGVQSPSYWRTQPQSLVLRPALRVGY